MQPYDGWTERRSSPRKRPVFLLGPWLLCISAIAFAHRPAPALGAEAAPRYGLDATATELTGRGCAPHCGKVLITGGKDPAGGEPLASAGLFDPYKKTFSAVDPMHKARASHAAVSLSGRCGSLCGQILVFGGSGPKGGLKSAELFDPRTGTWSPAGEMNRSGRQTFAVLEGTRCGKACGGVLAAGGDDPMGDVVEVHAAGVLGIDDVSGVDEECAAA